MTPAPARSRPRRLHEPASAASHATGCSAHSPSPVLRAGPFVVVTTCSIPFAESHHGIGRIPLRSTAESFRSENEPFSRRFTRTTGSPWPMRSRKRAAITAPSRYPLRPEIMKTYRVVELLGDGISPELSQSVRTVAQSLPCQIEFVPVDLSEASRKSRGNVLYDEAVAAMRQHGVAIKYPTATKGESPNKVLRERCHFAVIH